MEATVFDQSLQALSHRQPFRPFTVEFVNGERIEVDHPEALVVRAGVAVYLDAAGTPSWFDHEGVSRVIGAIDQAKPSGPQVETAQLSVAERITLVQEIWDSITATTEAGALTEAQKQVLDKRIAELEANPDKVVTWEEIKERMRCKG